MAREREQRTHNADENEERKKKNRIFQYNIWLVKCNAMQCNHGCILGNVLSQMWEIWFVFISIYFLFFVTFFFPFFFWFFFDFSQTWARVRPALGFSLYHLCIHFSLKTFINSLFGPDNWSKHQNAKKRTDRMNKLHCTRYTVCNALNTQNYNTYHLEREQDKLAYIT